MIAGGFDDMSKKGSFKFMNMKVTSNMQTEFAMGREPMEMSHLTMTTHSEVCIILLSLDHIVTFFFASLWKHRALVCIL